MKVKNIMFSGFAAAILMGVAAEANAASAKVVASKGYVDAITGPVTMLNGSAQGMSNLVSAINTKLGQVTAVTDSLDDGEYYSGVTQTVDGQVAVTKGALATAIEDGVDKAPTTQAVYDAIQEVSGDIQTYNDGTDIDIDENNNVNATYDSLDYSSQTDTANNADKLATGYSVSFIRQENGKVQVGAKAYIPNIDENTATEKQAPTTEAVYNALQGKQGVLDEDQMKAVNSGITEDKVAIYDEYATTKQDKLEAGNFVKIEDGKITTTYSAGDNITIGDDGKINTLFPEMPQLCSAEGVTCVLTSEGGEFAWAILTQPYSYTAGDVTDAEAIASLGDAAQKQKIPEQLYR